MSLLRVCHVCISLIMLIIMLFYVIRQSCPSQSTIKEACFFFLNSRISSGYKIGTLQVKWVSDRSLIKVLWTASVIVDKHSWILYSKNGTDVLFVEAGFAHVFGAQIFPLSHLIFLDHGLNLSLCLSHLNRRDICR